MQLDFTKESLLEGQILAFDKPFGWTSFYLVNKIRYYLCKSYGLKKLKVGHAGTLDPLATGLMIICTGKFTKQIESYQGLAKEYEAVIRLGQTTPSFDLETEVDKEYPHEHIKEEDIRNLFEEMIGESEQVPPLFSAKHLDGKRAYEYAREGIEMELKPVKITIHELELIEFNTNILKIRNSIKRCHYPMGKCRWFGKRITY